LTLPWCFFGFGSVLVLIWLCLGAKLAFLVRDCGAAPIARGKDAGELGYILQNVSAAILRKRVILQEPVIFQ